MARRARCNRVQSAVTQQVNVIEGRKVNTHAALLMVASGQLRFLGSNYDGRVVMNHIYFTAVPKGAGLAAEMAMGDGRGRVYIVEPTGAFEDDPNVTDKKFPGNPTRSYRSREPLRIVGELETWELFDADYIRQLKERVRVGMGEIIN